MKSLLPSPIDRLRKKSRRGFRGYPVATIAWYGPDDRCASKVAVGILQHEGAEADMTRWFSDTGDVRHDTAIAEAIVALLRENDVNTVAMVERIIGCPHEEGIDYPENEPCPLCPFWAGRDRFTGEG